MELNIPEISVVVPVYNVERYLQRCIESIINQSFKNYEIILVNDGSTDNSLNICLQYKKAYTNVTVLNKKNGGLSEARNYGIKIAKAKYVCFVDSDDYLEKDYLKTLYQSVMDNNADVAMCEYYLTNEFGRKYKRCKFNEPRNYTRINGYQCLKYLYKDGYTPNVVAWNKIYKREIFNHLQYEVGKYFEDEYMAVPLFWNINYVSLVRQPLYNYVQRSGSITNTSMNIKKVKDIMTFKKKRINFFKEKKCDILYGYAIQDYKNWIIEFVSTNKISSSKLKGTLQKEYRKNISVRYVNNPKILFKDIVGGINISLMGWLHKKVGNSQGM